MAAEPVITTSRSDYADAAWAIASQVFIDDPAFVYWLNTKPREWRVEFHPKLFRALVGCAAIENCYFLEANAWQSYVILAQPDVDPESTWTSIRAGWLGVFWDVGLGGAKRIAIDYIGVFKEARKRHLGSESHYFIYSCGTLEQHRRKGLMVALLKESVKIASSTNQPIWSEATTRGSCEAHLKAGFEMVEETIVGKGACNEKGEVEQGGEGVKMFCLVWRPKKVEATP